MDRKSTFQTNGLRVPIYPWLTTFSSTYPGPSGAGGDRGLLPTGAASGSCFVKPSSPLSGEDGAAAAGEQRRRALVASRQVSPAPVASGFVEGKALNRRRAITLLRSTRRRSRKSVPRSTPRRVCGGLSPLGPWCECISLALGMGGPLDRRLLGRARQQRYAAVGEGIAGNENVRSDCCPFPFARGLHHGRHEMKTNIRPSGAGPDDLAPGQAEVRPTSSRASRRRGPIWRWLRQRTADRERRAERQWDSRPRM